ncbi:MAG: hypothetical protein L0207_05805 [Chlamydiae bacterium]|nr:hypothetical protein [Chlamydiota bacterium]
MNRFTILFSIVPFLGFGSVQDDLFFQLEDDPKEQESVDISSFLEEEDEELAEMLRAFKEEKKEEILGSKKEEEKFSWLEEEEEIFSTSKDKRDEKKETLSRGKNSKEKMPSLENIPKRNLTFAKKPQVVPAEKEVKQSEIQKKPVTKPKVQLDKAKILRKKNGKIRRNSSVKSLKKEQK